MTLDFGQFLQKLKATASSAATEDDIQAFESATGLRLTAALRDVYLASDGAVLKRDQLEIMPLLQVKQLISGDDDHAPFLEYGISDPGYFPLIESFDSNPICVCCHSLMEGYVVQLVHDDSPVLLFRCLENFWQAISAQVDSNGWDWAVRDLKSDFEDDLRTERDTTIGRALKQIVSENASERATEIFSFSLQLLREEVSAFIAECTHTLHRAGLSTKVERNRLGPFICLDEGPVWLDTETLYLQKLEFSTAGDANRFQATLMEQANSRLAQARRAKARAKVVLTNAGNNKMAVIRIVRDMLALGLKEAGKALVDSAPCQIKDDMKLAEAEKFKCQLEDAGATVEIR